MTRIERYISFVYEDEKEKLENPLQYKTEHPRAYYEDNIGALRDELEKQFYWMFYVADIEKDEKFSYLDYHLERYTGHEINFLDFVKHSPMQPMEVNACIISEIQWREHCRGYLNEWVELRKDLVYNAKEGAKKINGKETKADQNLGSYRERIELKRLSLEETKTYFTNELTAVSPYTGEQIMTEDQVEHFLCANIEGFDPVKGVVKIKTRGEFKDVIDIIYRFYRKENNPNAPTAAYCQMALDNFYDLDSYTQLSSLQSNFSKYTKLSKVY